MIKILVVFSIFFSTIGFAENLTIKDLNEVQKGLKSFQHLSVDMEIKRYKPLRKSILVSTGKAYFSKPGSFRWQIIKKIPSEWLYDGKRLFNYDPRSNSAAEFKADGQRGKEVKSIVNAVMNFGELLKRFDLVNATREGHYVLANLTPKKGLSGQDIELQIDTKRSYVRFLKLSGPGENYMSVDFTNPVKKPIPASTYRLAKTVNVSQGI